ncbi:13312_t:CDS:2 [Funneliformis mosseae]|uniref:13312_t:CDS:1 n=1 Tax=Funneliformis mosseae TaxID=27381 RepID=A0A9N9H504_FUNMO|nr:13312_t:CDS:2 [Funneliformis mosseae]
MLAGHDTSNHRKDVQIKVREEILRVLGDTLTPTIDQQRELKYLNMVHQLPKRENSETIKFRNHVFLPKKPILINIYEIHHSPKYWEDPEEFIAERFENENDEKREQYTWLAV